MQILGGRIRREFRSHRALVLVVLVAFIVRLVWFAFARPEPVSDFLFYRLMGASLLDDHMFGIGQPTAVFLPGYPLVLAVLMLVSRSTVWLSFWMILLSTVAVWQIYLLANRLTGRRDVALVAAGAMAIFPTAVMYSSILGTEHLFSVLMLGAILSALRLGTGTWKRSLGVGMLLGLAVLTRGEAMFYLPVLLVLVWFVGTSRARVVKLRCLVLLVAGVGVVVSPWVIRNAVVVQPGITLSTVGGMNFYLAHNPDHYGWTAEVPWSPGQDLEANQLGWALGLEYIRDHPLSVLTSTAKGTYKLFATPVYAFTWNVQRPVGDSVQLFEPKPVPGERILQALLAVGAALYLSITAVSVLLWRRWSLPMRILVPGLVFCNWLGYAVLFFGDPRFRYLLDLVFCIPVAMVLVALRRIDDGSVLARTGGVV